MPHQARPILCYVTDRRALAPSASGLAATPSGWASAELLAVIGSAIAAGVDWIQIREKDLLSRPLLELVRQAVAAARYSATWILVNDRLDVALAAAAAGVHLGGESLPVGDVQRWCRTGHAPEGFLVGASCHSLAEAQQAERDAADYVVFGPVFFTPAKVQYGAPQGTGKLEEVCRGVRIPVLAIGGIMPENAAECIRAGAAGIAAIRLFQQATDLAAVVAQLRSVLAQP